MLVVEGLRLDVAPSDGSSSESVMSIEPHVAFKVLYANSAYLAVRQAQFLRHDTSLCNLAAARPGRPVVRYAAMQAQKAPWQAGVTSSWSAQLLMM